MLTSLSKSVLSIGLFSLLASCTTSKTFPDQISKDEASNSTMRFSVIGDLPYNPTQAYSLTRFITPSLKNSDFVIHLGDFKAGSNVACSSALDQNHLAWMQSVGVPVFYTPGDNDWADCDRISNAPVVRETERLAQIRSVFYPIPTSVPADWKAEWQAGSPENSRWVYKDVQFATANVIGGNNGRDTLEPCAPGTVCDTRLDISNLVAAREKQSLVWISSTFEKAKNENANAVVLAIHADIFNMKHPGVDCTNSGQIDCDGFKTIRQTIIKKSAEFKKPVLLVHGDTGAYCWDRKMGGESAPNLVRLNSAGDFVLIDAVDITFDPKSRTPFHAEGTISELLPAENQCRRD